LNLNHIRRAALPGIAAVALAASLAACGSSNSSSGGSSSLSGTVAAGGSTAQQTAQQAWYGAFKASNPNVKISYDAVGSGDGRAGFEKGTYSFVGSDSPMDPKADLPAATKQCGGDPIQIPVFISPIDVAFNLPGVKSLNLDANTIASIFAGKITKWNDPAIAKQNSGVKLPSTTITPVHRSDSSGTTDNFTDYLHQAAPSVWTNEHNSDWPLKGGEGQEGTSGVVGDVKDNPGTIAYIDDSGVEKQGLGVAKIKVGSTYVAPSAQGAANGLAASTLAKGGPSTVMTYQINRTTTDPSNYPVFMASNEIACQKYSSSATTDIVKSFLTYIISNQGQQVAAKNAYSAPLPSSVVSAEQKIIAKMG